MGDKLYAASFDQKGILIFVIRLSDGATIPPDTKNKDFLEYLAYADAGGDITPLPPIPDDTQKALDAAKQVMLDGTAPVDKRFDALITFLGVKATSTATPAVTPADTIKAVP